MGHEDAGLRDRKLLHRLHAGDESVFEAIFRANYTELVSFANQYVSSLDEAEELVSSMFAYLYEIRHQWNVRTTIRAYLYSSVRYRLLNMVRTSRRERVRYDLLLADAHESIVPSSGKNPEQLLLDVEDRQQQSAAISKALTYLSPRTRLILSLRWRENMSFDEIAEVLGISNAAVQMQMSRAMQTLRTIAPRYLK